MVKRSGNLIVMSGPSGTGKGTICKGLLQRCSGLVCSVSATTRQPRPGEVDGVHYHFITHAQFKSMIDHGQFLEWAPVYDNFYGTPVDTVKRILAAGQDILLEIDPQGAMQVKEKFPQGVYIYVLPPSMATLAYRINQRGTETPESVDRRLKAAVKEISYAYEYDYIIVNDDINIAIEQICAIIEAEKCTVTHNRYLVDSFISKGD